MKNASAFERDRVRLCESITGRKPGWDHHHAGSGNWLYLPEGGVETIMAAAEGWSRQVGNIERPWLCWCANEDWCLVQQRLVEAVGWTPVVGSDGTVTAPRLTKNAVFVDFNAGIGTPKMRPHFPLEFHFLFAPRLAFWHSDVLVPLTVMRTFADQFANLAPGQLVAVPQVPTLKMSLRWLLKRQPPFWKRLFEVVGCSTAEASRSQFEFGAGWWRHVEFHPHVREDIRRRKPYWEFGVGTWYWAQRHPGAYEPLCVDVEPYHYSVLSRSDYQRVRDSAHHDRSKGAELSKSFDVQEIASGLWDE